MIDSLPLDRVLALQQNRENFCLSALRGVTLLCPIPCWTGWSLPIGLPHHFLHSLAKHAHGRQSSPLELERPQVALLCRHRERHVDWLLYRYHLSILAGHHLRLALTRYRGSLSFSGILCRIWGLADLFRSASFTSASCASRSGTPGRSALRRRSLLGAVVRLKRLYRRLCLGHGTRRFLTEGLVQRAPLLALPLSHLRPPPKPSRTPPGTKVGPRIRPRSARAPGCASRAAGTARGAPPPRGRAACVRPTGSAGCSCRARPWSPRRPATPPKSP